MAGRPAKPRPSQNRDSLLDRLNADLMRFKLTGDREETEAQTGQRSKKGR